MPPPSGSSAPSTRSSYRAAPPLLFESEPFEGAALLSEHAGALGVVLWKSLRDVSAWTEADPADRRVLFPPAAAQERADELAGSAAEPELWAPLLVIQQLLAAPVEVDHPRLVHACRAIARWGERRGFSAVQLAFTQAAARLAPESPRLAYAVGRLARDRGEYARAESWLRASIRLARRTDWHTYALAYLSLGTLYQQLGNYPAARIVNLRGYRTAVRRRVRALEGLALHNLFAIATEMLDFKRGHEYARAACQCYGPAHPHFPALVHDVGCFWILHGCFGRAAAVLEGVLPRFKHSPYRVLVLANLARAAAAGGRRDLYESSYSEALRMLPETSSQERAAQVWMNLARASASAGDHLRAQAAAEAALEIATTLRLGHMRLELEALLDAIAAARRAGEALVPFVPAQMDANGEALAEDILRLLAQPVA